MLSAVQRSGSVASQGQKATRSGPSLVFNRSAWQKQLCSAWLQTRLEIAHLLIFIQKHFHLGQRDLQVAVCKVVPAGAFLKGETHGSGRADTGKACEGGADPCTTM